MDLTWDDTNDNWYGDLDQRHLYFGLTDELMAIAHSDHTANYQKDGYDYRSTDLSNNYFVRNGKADEWAEKYADRIQQHLDAKEESFSIDADNQSFPPSISGIQNGTVAYAMNQREWKVQGAKVELTAASNVTKESNSKWSARYDLAAKYRIATLEKVIDDGSYRLAAALDARMAVSASASGCSLSSGAGALSLERDGATGLYRVSSGGLMLTESGNRAVLAEADGSASQLWRVSALGGGRYSFTSASGLALDDRGQRTSEGNTVWLYEPNGGPAQAWLLAGPAIPRTVDDGSYRLAAALDARMAVSASASGCSLSSGAGALSLERDGATGLYRVSSGGLMLTESGNRAVLARRTAPPRSCGASRPWAEAATHSRPPPGWRWTTGGSGPRRATRYGSTSPTGARPGVAARGPRDPPHGRRRLLPPRGRPRRPDGRVGLRIGLLAVLGRGRPLPRARRGDGPLQGLLGRPDAHRVGQPGGAGRGGRLRLAAVARLGPGRRPLLIHVRLRAGAGRPGAADLGGQHGMALRAERGARPGVGPYLVCKIFQILFDNLPK